MITSPAKMEKSCDDSGFLDVSWRTIEDTPGENPTDSGHESSSQTCQDSGTNSQFEKDKINAQRAGPKFVPAPELELKNRIDASQPFLFQNIGKVETSNKTSEELEEDEHDGIQKNTLLQQNKDVQKNSFSSSSIDLVMDKVDRIETSERLISGIDGILLVQKSQTAYMDNLFHQISEKMDHDRVDRKEESSRLMECIQALMTNQAATRSVVENQGRTLIRMETDYSGLYEMHKLINSRIDGMIREQHSLTSLIEDCCTNVSRLDANVQTHRRNLVNDESTSKGSSAMGSTPGLDMGIGLSSKTSNPIVLLKQLSHSKLDPKIKPSMTSRLTQTDPSFQAPVFNPKTAENELEITNVNTISSELQESETKINFRKSSTPADYALDTTQKSDSNSSTETRNTLAFSKYENNKTGGVSADSISDDNAMAEPDHSIEPKAKVCSVELTKDPITQTTAPEDSTRTVEAISAQKSDTTRNAGETDESKSEGEDISDEGISHSVEPKPAASDLQSDNVKAVCYSNTKSTVPKSIYLTAGVESDLSSTIKATIKAMQSAAADIHDKSHDAKVTSSGTELDTTTTELRNGSNTRSTKPETNTTSDHSAEVVPDSTPISSANAKASAECSDPQKASSTEPIDNALPSTTSQSANGSERKVRLKVRRKVRPIPSTELTTSKSDGPTPSPVAIQHRNVGVIAPCVIIPERSASTSNTPTENPLPASQQNPPATRSTPEGTNTATASTPAVAAPSSFNETTPARSPFAVTAPAAPSSFNETTPARSPFAVTAPAAPSSFNETTPARSPFAVTAPATSSSTGAVLARSTYSLTTVPYHPVTYDYGMPCYTGSRSSGSSSYSYEPTNKKHEQFVSESLRNKAVDSIPGIGKALGGRLASQGFEKASSISAAYRRMGGDQEKFENWIKNKSGANARQARAAFKGLRDYYD